MRVRIVCVVGLLALSVVALPALGRAGPPPGPDPGPNPCVGTMQAPADGTTVVSIQGLPPERTDSRPRLVGVGPTGAVEWVYRPPGATWLYDVDPIGHGRLFGVATLREGGESRTRLFVLDVRSRTVVWTETLDIADTHDADLLGPHRILIANMRAFRNGTSYDRLAIYNRTRGEFVWSWYFRDHFPRSAGGGIAADEDWTHVNDVDRIGPGRYLVSVKNFDQVIVVNRSTGGIDLRLGRENRHGIVRRQHNPTYLRGEDGRPTILVADSGNDRVVEYARTAGGWERTWLLESPRWVRDADRLPDGNTLVTASRGHRVMEVAPNGTVVWEFYAPWLTYEAERMAHGDEPDGPTIAERNASGTVRLTGDADPSTAGLERCARFLRAVESNWTRDPSPSPSPGPIRTASPTPVGGDTHARSPTPVGGDTHARSPATRAGTPTATATEDGTSGPLVSLGLAVGFVVLALVVLALAVLALTGTGRGRRGE